MTTLAPSTGRTPSPSVVRTPTPSTGNTRPSTGRPPAGGPTRTVSTGRGGTVSTGPGGRTNYKAGNTTATIHNGRPTQISRPNTTIHHPVGGTRTVLAQRGDRTVVVHGAGHGYVAHNVVVGNRTYMQRTYYGRGGVYVRAYRPVFFHGISVGFYAPVRFYPIGFYGWMGTPWAFDVDYAWGWGGDPWFGYYGPYFRPWRIYRRPSFWLTDYMIASTLQAAFEAREEARAAQRAAVAAAAEAPSLEASARLSDEVKEAIEAEVRRQIAEAQEEAQAEFRQSRGSADSVPSAFSDGRSHVFLVSDNLEVTNPRTGATCVISEGDAIQVNGMPRSDADVPVLVRASKGSDCQVNSTVTVHLTDLVEMHNSMREAIERGMDTLRQNQGKDNLPELPPAAAGEPVTTAYAEAMQPDADVAETLEQEANNADQIEQEVVEDYHTAASDTDVARGPSTVGPIAPPVKQPVNSPEAGLLASIQRGQTEAQVIAIMGQPLRMSFEGGVQKLYEYPLGKITFTDGEVSEVEQTAPGPAAPAPAPPPPGTVRSTPAPPPAPAPVSSGRIGGVTVGMTESQVIAIMGQPGRVSFVGGLQKMYEYGSHKVIFRDGQVSEVQ